MGESATCRSSRSDGVAIRDLLVHRGALMKLISESETKKLSIPATELWLTINDFETLLGTSSEIIKYFLRLQRTTTARLKFSAGKAQIAQIFQVKEDQLVTLLCVYNSSVSSDQIIVINLHSLLVEECFGLLGFGPWIRGNCLREVKESDIRLVIMFAEASRIRHLK
jgi:hypothetical protein